MPKRHESREARAFRVDGTQENVSRSQNGGRHPIDAPSLAVGCIVWLPPKEENGKDIVCSCHGGKLDSQGYDHPVVVLKLQGVQGNLSVSMCSVACVSWFFCPESDRFTNRD